MENKFEQKLQTINDIVEVLNKEAKWGKFEFNFIQHISPFLYRKGTMGEDYVVCKAIFEYRDKREDDICNVIILEESYPKRIIDEMVIRFIEMFLSLLIRNILYIRTYTNLKDCRNGSIVYINFSDLLKNGFVKRNLEVSE
jgi:hypothetical protein